MAGVKEIVKLGRRKQVLKMVSEGYNVKEISDEMKLDRATVTKDLEFIKDEAKKFLESSVSEGTAQMLYASLTNITEVVKDASKIFKNSMDERSKLMALRLILDGAELRNKTVLDGFNHLTIKKSNDMLEHALNLQNSGQSEETKALDSQKSLMPPIIVNMQPEKVKVEIEGVKSDEDEEETEKIEQKVVVTDGKSGSLESLREELSPHVKTNIFYKKESEPDPPK